MHIRRSLLSTVDFLQSFRSPLTDLVVRAREGRSKTAWFIEGTQQKTKTLSLSLSIKTRILKTSFHLAIIYCKLTSITVWQRISVRELWNLAGIILWNWSVSKIPFPYDCFDITYTFWLLILTEIALILTVSERLMVSLTDFNGIIKNTKTQ